MDPSNPAQPATEPAHQQQVPRPLNSQEKDLLAQLDRLKFFLATAPSRWASSTAPQQPQSQSQHPALNRFLLPSGEYVSCVLWNGLYHITGTDIVRALVFRFEAFGRPVTNMKKFEEGVFSDLRNLKPGTDASLEEPKVCCAYHINPPHLSCHNSYPHSPPTTVRLPRSPLQVPVYPHSEEAKSLLLVRPSPYLPPETPVAPRPASYKIAFLLWSISVCRIQMMMMMRRALFIGGFCLSYCRQRPCRWRTKWPTATIWCSHWLL